MTSDIKKMKDIVKKINDFDDKMIYLTIFNKLTNDGELTNYSHNSNGIFFDLSIFDIKKLTEIEEDLDRFKKTQKNAESAIIEREKIIYNFRQEIKSNTTISEFSTNLDEENEDNDIMSIYSNSSRKSINSDDLFGDYCEEEN
jgi:hypothetical protein